MLAELSVSPFGTSFRFSLGPIGLAFIAMYFGLPVQLLGLIAGLLVPIGHGLVVAFTHTGASPGAVMASYSPETMAYAFLGLLLYLFRGTNQSRPPLHAVLCIAGADFLTNLTELVVRTEPFLPTALLTLAMVAASRATVAVAAAIILQEGARARQWAADQQRYTQSLLFACNLQTEAFFLQKSAREMEQIMAKAHRLYRDLDDHPDQPLALEIAKDIHEIKKDYQRTLAALYRLVDAPGLDPIMNFAEIVALVLDANRMYAASLGKRITLHPEVMTDFRTARYGRWVSILNNLVSNAIEACPADGKVTVLSGQLRDRFVLEVADTGSGIPREDWELIFSPGFSTKLNPVTGSFSSGIGLTHVAGLAKAMNGVIRVERSNAAGTVFRLEVPWDSLETVDQEE